MISLYLSYNLRSNLIVYDFDFDIDSLRPGALRIIRNVKINLYHITQLVLLCARDVKIKV